MINFSKYCCFLFPYVFCFFLSSSSFAMENHEEIPNQLSSKIINPQIYKDEIYNYIKTIIKRGGGDEHKYESLHEASEKSVRNIGKLENASWFFKAVAGLSGVASGGINIFDKTIPQEYLPFITGALTTISAASIIFDGVCVKKINTLRDAPVSLESFIDEKAEKVVESMRKNNTVKFNFDKDLVRAAIKKRYQNLKKSHKESTTSLKLIPLDIQVEQ